jgi:hypothetical protein
MQRYGHDLDFQRAGEDVVGVCKCGKWRVVVPAPTGDDVVIVVARIMGEHEKHLDGLGKPARTQPPPQ